MIADFNVNDVLLRVKFRMHPLPNTVGVLINDPRHKETVFFLHI